MKFFFYNYSWKPIIQHIDNKFEEYLSEESKVHRQPFPDNRVHCCLYFIAPTGHCLKPLDIEFMKKLHNKVQFLYNPCYDYMYDVQENTQDHLL